MTGRCLLATPCTLPSTTYPTAYMPASLCPCCVSISLCVCVRVCVPVLLILLFCSNFIFASYSYPLRYGFIFPSSCPPSVSLSTSVPVDECKHGYLSVCSNRSVCSLSYLTNANKMCPDTCKHIRRSASQVNYVLGYLEILQSDRMIANIKIMST